MKQATLNLDLHCKKTRKREFLEEMEQVVPWGALVSLIAPYYPEGRNGRPPFALESMLRIHFMQQWCSLSDPAMGEAFFDVPLYREFAQLPEFERLPDQSSILRFRDATLIAAPTSTKNKDKARDPEMHSSKKGNQWYFDMKAHIGVDADSGLVHVKNEVSAAQVVVASPARSVAEVQRDPDTQETLRTVTTHEFSQADQLDQR